MNRRGPNHDGSCVNKFRLRKLSDVNASIEAGLADTDRHTDIGRLCRIGKKDIYGFNSLQLALHASFAHFSHTFFV